MKERIMGTINAVNDVRKKARPSVLRLFRCRGRPGACRRHLAGDPKIPSLLADEDTASDLYVGETLSLLQADVTEKQVTRVEKQVVWTSSDESVATVDTDGTITTLGAGTATVTAQVKDNSYTYLVSVSEVPTIVAEADEDEALEAETSSEAEPEAEEADAAASEVEAEASSEAEPEASSEAAPETSSEAEPETSSEAEAAPEASSEAEPEASSEAEPETSSEAEPEVSSETEPETSSEAEPEASSEAKPEASSEAEPEADAEEVEADPVLEKMCIDDTSQLSLSDDCETVTWSSSNTSVATITQDGVVTALSSGAVTITATIDERVKSTTIIEVLEPALTAETGTMYVGSTGLLSMENYNQEPTWVSSNPEVATADGSGVVTGLTTGTTTFTTEIAGTTYSVEMTVCNLPTLAGGSVTIDLAGEKTLTFDADLLEGATTSWSSEDESIATVDENGTVTGVAPGTTNIVCSLNGCAVSASVTVNTPTLDYTEITLVAGSIYELELSGANKDAADWSVSDEAVASVTQNGTVTATGAGDCVISVKINEYEVTCELHIPEPTLSQSTLTLTVGGTGTLAMNQTFSEELTWVSSNSAVATVDESGIVTAVAAGTCTISCTANGITSTCEVTVNAAAVAASTDKDTSSSNSDSSSSSSSGSSSSSTTSSTSSGGKKVLAAAASFVSKIRSDGNWYYKSGSNLAKHRLSCGTFVSYVLKSAGYATGTVSHASSGSTPYGASNLVNCTIIKTNNKSITKIDLQPGDIVVRNGGSAHCIAIFAYKKGDTYYFYGAQSSKEVSTYKCGPDSSASNWWKNNGVTCVIRPN
ncbi:MAG: Ig-like domain-containing protein [Clostridiales bacterium]|nr:Ig-like domain-containing protein [Clostridiales bacterium]